MSVKGEHLANNKPAPKQKRFKAHQWLEKRVAPRLRLQAAARYSSGPASGEGIVKNMSRSGALIENVSNPLRPGTKVTLHICLVSGAEEMQLSAEVVRETPEGFAIRFVGLESRQATLLSVLLSKASKEHSWK